MMTADSDVFFGNMRNSLILPSWGYTRRKLMRLHALRRHRKTHLWGMAVGQRDAFVTDLSFPSILYLHTFPLNKLYGVKKRRKLTQTSGTVAEHCFKRTNWPRRKLPPQQLLLRARGKQLEFWFLNSGMFHRVCSIHTSTFGHNENPWTMYPTTQKPFRDLNFCLNLSS